MLARSAGRAPGRALASSASESERLVRLKQHAMKALEPLLNADGVGSIVRVGDAAVINVLWTAADVTLDKEGQLDEGEYERFVEAARSDLSSITQDLINTSVIDALLLTIVLPLALTGEGSTRGPFEPSLATTDASSAELQHSAWADAATYLTNNPAEAASLRRAFFVVEMVLLYVSVGIAFGGMFCSVSLMRLLSVLGNRVLAQCEMVIASSRYFSILGLVWGLGLFTLALALPFVAARYSALAFFCSFFVFFFFIVLQVLFVAPGKAAAKLVRLEAARIYRNDSGSSELTVPSDGRGQGARRASLTAALPGRQVV